MSRPPENRWRAAARLTGAIARGAALDGGIPTPSAGRGTMLIRAEDLDSTGRSHVRDDRESVDSFHRCSRTCDVFCSLRISQVGVVRVAEMKLSRHRGATVRSQNAHP